MGRWKFGHVFFSSTANHQMQKILCPVRLMIVRKNRFGGDEDYVWNPDSKHIVYVTKESYGTKYTVSTNTDIFSYDIESGTTKNLTEGMKGYDIGPLYNKKGELAWLSMKREGYEADNKTWSFLMGLQK